MNSSLNEIEELKKQILSLKHENDRLKRHVEQHSIIFERALDAIIIFDKDTNFVDVNSAACNMFELPKEELIGRNFSDFLELVPPEKIANHVQLLKQVGALSDELLIKLDNGTIKHIEFAWTKNAFNGMDLSIMRDISIRKILERERFISEQMFKDVFNRAIDGIVIFDESRRLIDVNPAFCKSMEMRKDKLLHYTIDDFVPDEYQFKLEKIKTLLKQKGQARGNLPLLLEDGQKKIFEFTTTSNIYNNYFMSIMRDITEKRDMQIKLSKSEERFKNIFEHAMDAIVIWDDNAKIINGNPAASRLFEVNPGEMTSYNLLDFTVCNPKELNRIFSIFMEKGEIREELMFQMPNGQRKQLEFTSKKHVIDDYNMTIFRNVSNTRRMEKELRESEQKFRQIFDNAMDGIILWNEDRIIIDANTVAAEIANMEKEDFIGSCIYELVRAETALEVKTAANISDTFGENQGQILFQFVSGRERILEYASKKNIIPGTHMTLFRDITEKREMEEQLRKSDTLNVVGELAAGIAHEIRNPMTALKGFIQLLEGSVKEDFSMYFNVITSELNRIESIITEFLILAKPQAIQYKRKDMAMILKETVDLLQPQALLDNVEIDYMPGEPGQIVYGEPNQLKQVFINVLKNAIEVMPNGGTITVRTGCTPDGRIKISITDQGNGIPKDKLKKLGEPFYTTKERGTGLGLMVSYKIIEEHKGTVEVESEVGKGTTFSIFLPSYKKSIN